MKAVRSVTLGAVFSSVLALSAYAQPASRDQSALPIKMTIIQVSMSPTAGGFYDAYIAFRVEGPQAPVSTSGFSFAVPHVKTPAEATKILYENLPAYFAKLQKVAADLKPH